MFTATVFKFSEATKVPLASKDHMTALIAISYAAHDAEKAPFDGRSAIMEADTGLTLEEDGQDIFTAYGNGIDETVRTAERMYRKSRKGNGR